MGKDKIPSIAPFHYRYPLLSKESLPEEYKLFHVSHRDKELKEYDPLFFHRLMKKNYGDPSDIEFELETRKKLENGNIKALGKEWKYYVRSQTGGIIQVGTERLHTTLAIHHILHANIKKPSGEQIQGGTKFVDDLLREAGRLKDQLLNPKREFNEGEGVHGYFLDNVFLYNYDSADLMREYAEDDENKLNSEFLKYDAEETYGDKEKMAHTDKFMRAVGMYYAASILYYFMALEGFVNLIYEAFLKNEFRSLNIETRLDLELKISFMSGLCYGFKRQPTINDLGIHKDFKILKNFRNQTFHSRTEDSLKNVTFFESGFLYLVKMDKDTGGLLPLSKINLRQEHVLKVKSIVDNIIKNILDKMQNHERKLVEKYIIKMNTVPFKKDGMGGIRFGFTIEDTGNGNNIS